MKHLERAFDGQNQWWKYPLVFIIALFIGQSFGAIPLVILVVVKVAMSGGQFTPSDNVMDFSAYGIDPNLGLFLIIIPFLVVLLLAVVLIKAFHQRTPKDVINGGNKFRWKQFWVGVLVWGVIVGASFIYSLITDPGNFEMRFDVKALIPLVFISIVFIPFQAGTEELLFRGYLAQGVAAWTKQPWMVIIIPSLMFALVHSMNPEVGEYGFWTVMPQYFLFGCVFAVVSILDKGIELAIGVHAINNIFSSIFVTTKSSVLQTAALFLQKEVNPAGEFWGLLIASVIFMGILTFLYKWDFKILTQKVKPSEEVKAAVAN